MTQIGVFLPNKNFSQTYTKMTFHENSPDVLPGKELIDYIVEVYK